VTAPEQSTPGRQPTPGGPPLPSPPPPTAGDGCCCAYEVDDELGQCLYRGTDIELAHEIYAADPHAHLLPLGPAKSRSAPDPHLTA